MAAPGTKVRVAGLKNLSIAPLSVDTSSTTTIGTAIPLGAQSRLTVTMQGTTADLETSNAIQNSKTWFKAGSFTIENGEIDLAVFDLLMGGKLYSDSAGGKDIWAYVAGSNGGYFAILGQPDVAEGGPADAYICVLKAKAESFPELTLGGNAWSMQSITGRFFPVLKDNSMFAVVNLTAAGTVTFSAAQTDITAAITSGT